jgi:hypothetical protein
MGVSGPAVWWQLNERRESSPLPRRLARQKAAIIMAKPRGRIGTHPRGAMDPMGPAEPDPNVATEDDLRNARAIAVRLHELLASPQVRVMLGVNGPAQSLVGCALLGAVLMGKLKAEAETEPESYGARFLVLLEREMAFIQDEALRGRRASLSGAEWTPIEDLRQRALHGGGITCNGKGGDA